MDMTLNPIITPLNICLDSIKWFIYHEKNTHFYVRQTIGFLIKPEAGLRVTGKAMGEKPFGKRLRGVNKAHLFQIRLV
jgi:hypothetical protein